jgi:hypothetical protein
MRLCMFHPIGHPLERGWVGRIDGGHVTQLAAQTLQSYFTGGGTAREHAAYLLDEVRLLAPVLHPPAVRIFDDEMSFVFANPAAIVGPGAEVTGAVLLPRIAAVIGADGAIGGYTAFADWRRPARAQPKDRDFALGLGPVVATPDELGDGVDVAVLVDGGEQLRGRFDVDWQALRDLAAEGTRLYPGDLLAGPAVGEVEIAGSSVEIDVATVGVLDQVVA